MLKLVCALLERIKALVVVDAGLQLQMEIASRSAERKAALYRLAAQYEAEGLNTVAHDLRRQAEALHLQQSFDDTVPALDDLLTTEAHSPSADGAPGNSPSGRAALAATGDPKPPPAIPSRPRKR